MKAVSMFSMLLGLAFGHLARAEDLKHVFKEDETLWFLAQIYYGDGARYQHIQEANHLKSDRVQPGRSLIIPQALFKPEHPGFELRLAHLRSKRAEILGKRQVASQGPVKMVVLPKYKVIHPELVTPSPRGSILEKAKAEVGGE